MHIFTAGQMLTAPSPIRGYGYVTAGWDPRRSDEQP